MILPNVRRVVAALLLYTASNASAHGLVCQCEELADQQIRCKGGFASGAGAPNVILDVIGYDEQIHIAGKLDANSTFTFKRPAGAFYVLMDVGPGHVLEVDSAQIPRRVTDSE